MILAFDTSGPACLAALSNGTQIVDHRVDEMAKGQAEHLMPMLEDLLHRNGKTWSDITRIGVGVGPGNFTGIRISVSAARGLALGLAVPAIGVSALDAIHHVTPDATAAVPAPRDMLYAKTPRGKPVLCSAQDVPNPSFIPSYEALVTAIAQCAALTNPETAERPKPLYIKPADAAPAKDSAPKVLK